MFTRGRGACGACLFRGRVHVLQVYRGARPCGKCLHGDGEHVVPVNTGTCKHVVHVYSTQEQGASGACQHRDREQVVHDYEGTVNI
jgi:hypothetical protein